jgi:prophage antirepressor-like protein
MSKLIKLIYKIFNNIIELNGINIVILYDKNNKIWFSLNDIYKSLGYKNIKAEIQRHHIHPENITRYKFLFNELSKNQQQNIINQRNNIQPHMKMISEAGIYTILDTSKKPIAKEFKEELINKILPEFRQTGNIKTSIKDKLKIKKLEKKLTLINKEQSLHNKTKKIYNDDTGYGFIYVLETKILKNGVEKKCYKIGYTKDLNKRLNTYKTGNPDIELVYSENVNCNKKQLEKCVLNLNSLKRLSSKNEIICNNSLDEIKREITDCKKLIKKH